jgi:hypothetical protein
MILPIKQNYCLCEPFCDYLTITTPKDNDKSLLNDVMPILDALGCYEDGENQFYEPLGKGLFKIYTRGNVDVYNASGAFLGALRSKGLFNDLLMQIANYPHKVTRLDATVDFRLDAPEYLEEIYQRGSTGLINLTRKSVNTDHVTRLSGKNREGIDTGTVFLGSKEKSEVYAVCYDKRQETLFRDRQDPGLMLRIEIRIKGQGATLRDVSKPHDIFYNYACKSLVEPPEKFTGWVGYGEGFELETSKDNFTVWERLWSKFSNSRDIEKIVTLALDEYGSDALEELTKLLRKRIDLKQKSLLV